METSKRINYASHGGVYSVAHFSDKDGNPTDKEHATHVEIVEYDKDDKGIFRTYGIISRKGSDKGSDKGSSNG
jgi:hypothetical protein